MNKVDSANGDNSRQPCCANAHLSMTHIVYIVVFYAFLSYHFEALAAPIAGDGTILIVDHILPAYIILGAEARATDNISNGYDRKDVCKIRRLDDHAAFASSGRSTLRANSTVLYDAWSIAQDAFLPGDNLTNVAQRWAVATETAYYSAYVRAGEAVLRGLVPESVVTGVFAGGINFGAVTVVIKYRRDSSTISFYHDPPSAVTGIIRRFSTPIGMEGLQEVLHGESDRAKAKRDEIRTAINERKYQTGDAEAFKIDMAIDAALLWSDGRDPKIGGEISTLILENNESIKWFHESKICHQTWRD
jgi:hypothetical protein